MNLLRSFSVLLLVFFFCVFFSSTSFAEHYHLETSVDSSLTIIKTPVDGGIREDIPDKYKERYQKWKEELLSTEFGRQQWNLYADNKQFILTIKMSGDKGFGAGTGKYLWDESGNFVGATIVLGNKIDRGYPDPIYYPVMNSLSSSEASYSINGNILAATKLAHEIGHVNQTSKSNITLFQTQNKLVPLYISIFLSNGRNARDQKLLALAEQMGGTPIEIWENREYWSEVNALSFLKERLSKENFYCNVISKIKYNVVQYARDYGERFDEEGELSQIPCRK